jgi:hypothetical protein
MLIVFLSGQFRFLPNLFGNPWFFLTFCCCIRLFIIFLASTRNYFRLLFLWLNCYTTSYILVQSRSLDILFRNYRCYGRKRSWALMDSFWLIGFSFNFGLYLLFILFGMLFVLFSFDWFLKVFPRRGFWLYCGFMRILMLIHYFFLFSWAHHWINLRLFFSLVFLLVIFFLILILLLRFLLFGLFKLRSCSRIRWYDFLSSRKTLYGLDGHRLFDVFV